MIFEKVEESEEATGGGADGFKSEASEEEDPKKDVIDEIFIVDKQIVHPTSTKQQRNTTVKNNNTSTSSNTMTGTKTMDSNLKHLITYVCGINETKPTYKAVLNEGITDVDDFLCFGFETPFHYGENCTKTAIHRNHQTILSQVMAYAIHLERTNNANAKNFTAYTKADFDEWRRLHYLQWVAKKKATGSAAASNTKEKFDLESFV